MGSGIPIKFASKQKSEVSFELRRRNLLLIDTKFPFIVYQLVSLISYTIG